jgi:hypothetical protein
MSAIHSTTTTGNTDSLRRWLELLVAPACAAEAGGADACEIVATDGGLCLRGALRGVSLVEVRPVAIDDERTLLRIGLLAGMFAGDVARHAMVVGSLLDPTPFAIRCDAALACFGQLTIGCDLVVRADDAALVRQRLARMLDTARDLEWFFPLRLPSRLSWVDITDLEIPWEELPHDDLDGFVDAGMAAPACERTPLALLRLAHALGRWRDVLRLLREHPDEFPRRTAAPLRALANRALGRWLPALAAARAGRVRDGRFRGAPWLSPSFLHALIESGDEIEALRLLGRARDGEPGFYDWLRGLALHRAGDRAGALDAFDRYFARWPGDVIGGVATRRLVPGEC